ncbi:hypothetical protein [Glycomyces salinus]|uniref:hypothetical protein n=1 Tax=Glycomyces salinus TaxID=980294 RepID=UPI0018EB807C|nr:hypothetical protein [Glycomyces salinus]
MPTGSAPTAPGTGVGPRLTFARKAAGYLGAGTLSLYLLLKVYWVVAAFFGIGVDPDSSAANWIGINTVTVGMAVIGVAVALALAQDWGRRVPAWMVVFTSWTAAGFLVSIIPVHAIRAFLPAQGDPVDVELGVHSWELTLVAVGFIGMGVGLTVAGPIYLRERWPAAFVGVAGDHRPPRSRSAAVGIALALVVAATTLYWLLGGEVFVNDSIYDTGDPNTAALFCNEAFWALAAAASAWVLLRARSRVPAWIPMALLWIGSGSLFAWNCWRLFISLVFAPFQTMNTLEQPFAAIAVEAAGALAGALLFATALAVYSARRGRVRELRSRAWSPPDSPRPPTSTR